MGKKFRMKKPKNKKLLFDYKRSFKTQGRIYIMVAAVLAVIWCVLISVNPQDLILTFFLGLGQVIVLCVSLVMALRGAQLIRRNGGWHIQLTRERLIWSVDADKQKSSLFQEDDSFNVALKDIDHVEFEDSFSDSSDGGYRYYANVFLTDGNKFRVTSESGVLYKLEALLRNLGLQVQVNCN